MANRFNNYQNVDYVPLPLEAYQLAASTKEAENMAKLNSDKNAYDSMRAIEAIANPDVELKNHIINDINKQIGDLGAKNLKGSDVLMKINSIVTNPDYVNKLAAIYGNTKAYRDKIEMDGKYQEEFGNDINTLQSTDEWNTYNSKGMADFRPGMLRNYTPGKFIDVVGETQ